jgi:hypothetical protein
MTNQLPAQRPSEPHHSAPQPQYAAPQHSESLYSTPQPQSFYVVAAAPRPPSNTAATTALITGIIAMLIGFWTWVPFIGLFSGVITLGLGITAIITGFKGLRVARELGGAGYGAALTGQILGWVSCGGVVLISFLSGIFWLIALAG